MASTILQFAQQAGETLVGSKSSVVGNLLNGEQFASIQAFTVSYDISSVALIQVPSVGLPVISAANVEVDPSGVSTFETTLSLPATEEDPFEAPVLQNAELNFDVDNPKVVLTVDNLAQYLINNNNGNTITLKGTTVKFQVGDRTYSSIVSSFQDLGNNQFEIEVEPPADVPLGSAKISVIRTQTEQIGSNPTDTITVDYESNFIRLEGESGYVISALPFSDEVAVFEGVEPETVVTNGSSEDLLIAKIPVGKENIDDNPRELAITKDGSRVYVSLQFSGAVALVDPILLRQIDTDPYQFGLNPIDLPGNAAPRGIAIGSLDRYAYVADGNQGLIYVIDIDPNSETYHQVIKTIQVNPAPDGLRQLAISSDGRKLFATAPNPRNSDDKSHILVINVDPSDKPLAPNSNTQIWHEQIGTIETEEGTEGITASSQPDTITFTNRRNEVKGYGVLKITNDDPLSFAATINYGNLGIGYSFDYFDVNEAVSIALTKDGRYGFVAGFNGRLFGSGIESIDGVQAGSNIGIIENPLGENPVLVAATRPIPMALTKSLTLSQDDRYLYCRLWHCRGRSS